MELRTEARLAIRDAADLDSSAPIDEVTDAMDAETTEATEAELAAASSLERDAADSAGVEGVATAALAILLAVRCRTRLRVVVVELVVRVGDAT